MSRSHDTPSAEPVHGQPSDVFDLVNKYGTYNIQPTADSEHPFPMIAQGLPRRDRTKAITKEKHGKIR